MELGWESEASALLQAQIWAGGVSVRWNPWVWGAGGARENLELLTGALSPHSQELQLHLPPRGSRTLKGRTRDKSQKCQNTWLGRAKAEFVLEEAQVRGKNKEIQGINF